MLSICLVGCKDNKTIDNFANEKYIDMVELLNQRLDFKDSSEFFDISGDISKINDGYRFYIVVDNVKTAMYNVEVLAIEKNVDYNEVMAANIGIFEKNKYSLIPNQVNPEDGFVKGVSVSGISNGPVDTYYVLVQWHNKDLSITSREYIKLNIRFGEDNVN